MSISEKIGQQQSLTEKHRALQHFTNRNELTRRFAEYLNDDHPHERILFFYGDGGNGKSLLVKFLQENCCKSFSADIWQELKAKTNAEVADFIQNVTDWECDFKPVPAVLLDFDQKPIDDDRPQDPFYGLLMLRRGLVSAAARLEYKLNFPLYEFACVWYLKQKGKLTNELLNKLFPTTELFFGSGIITAVKEIYKIVKSTELVIPLSFLPSLASNILSIIAKYLGEDLTLYLRGWGIKQEHIQKIMQLDSDKELIHALPGLFAEELNITMQRPDAPPRIVLFFDTHEAFWGDWRNRGEARFFMQDEWLRALLAQLELSRGIVVVVAGREIPRWAEASQWSIVAEKLELKQVFNFTTTDAHRYLQRVGIEDEQWRETLINQCACIETDRVHPFSLGLSADVFLTAKEKGEPLTPADLPNSPQMNQKLKGLVELLLKYVDEEIGDAVDALSACRAFNRELYFKLSQALHFNPTNAAFRTLTRFSFVWQAEQWGQDWYRIHPLVCRLNRKRNQEMTQSAHTFLEEYYREQSNVAEAIYHAYWQNQQRAIEEWLEVFERAKQQEDFELCRTLAAIRKELSF
jgi:hypothetical protein